LSGISITKAREASEEELLTTVVMFAILTTVS
jgi:hypothetical protein